MSCGETRQECISLCSEDGWACPNSGKWLCRDCMPWVIQDELRGVNITSDSDGELWRYCSEACAQEEADDLMSGYPDRVLYPAKMIRS